MGMNLSVEQWRELLRWLWTGGPGWAALVLSLYIWKQSRPVRRVTIFPNIPLHLLDQPWPFPDLRPCIFVTFINEQGPVVVLQDVGFESADGTKVEKTRFYPDDADLPVEVPPGHSVCYSFEIENLRSRVRGKPVPAWAYCRGATGRYYKTPLSQEIRSALLE